MFIIETSKPKKLWLKITLALDDTMAPAAHKITLPVNELRQAMLQAGILLHEDVDKIDGVGVVGGYHIFMCKFTNRVCCSKTSEADFIGTIDTDEGGIDASTMMEKYYDNVEQSNLGWAFITLGDKRIKPTKSLFLPIPVSESERLSALEDAIKTKGVIEFTGDHGEHHRVKVTSTRIFNSSDYCQFSGGDDLYLQFEGGSSAVLCMDMEEVEVSPDYESDIKMKGAGVIERDSSIALTNQLKANMVVACVKQFLHEVSTITQENIRKLEVISCHGIACTGLCEFTFIKVEIDFSKESITFYTRIPFLRSGHVQVAALIDYSLCYIAKKNI